MFSVVLGVFDADGTTTLGRDAPVLDALTDDSRGFAFITVFSDKTTA